jgi:hypothetical protein
MTTSSDQIKRSDGDGGGDDCRPRFDWEGSSERRRARVPSCDQPPAHFALTVGVLHGISRDPLAGPPMPPPASRQSVATRQLA